MRLVIVIATVVCLGAWPGVSAGQRAGRPAVGPTADVVPSSLEKVGFDQRLGAQLPLDAPFVDASGVRRRLGDFFAGRPIVLAFVYYDCPMLCSLVLDGITASFRALDLSVGRDYEVVAVSFDPREGPALAAGAKATAVSSYGRPGSADGWHFLTGGEEAIQRATDAAGFRYVWDEAQQQYAHAAGIVVATPTGQVARYFYGIDFPPRDLRLGLVEASQGSIGTVVDQVLLYCFQYDPATGEYSVATLAAVRIGGVVTVVGLGAFLAVMFRRERQRVGSPAREGVTR